MGNASSRGFAQGRPTCAPEAQPLEVRTNGDGESDWDNRILYCGYRLDPETGADGQGIMHVRHRPYLPPLGQWITRDPLNQDVAGGGYHDGMGLYEYGRGAVANLRDPWGLEVSITWGDSQSRGGPWLHAEGELRTLVAPLAERMIGETWETTGEAREDGVKVTASWTEQDIFKVSVYAKAEAKADIWFFEAAIGTEVAKDYGWRAELRKDVSRDYTWTLNFAIGTGTFERRELVRHVKYKPYRWQRQGSECRTPNITWMMGGYAADWQDEPVAVGEGCCQQTIVFTEIEGAVVPAGTQSTCIGYKVYDGEKLVGTYDTHDEASEGARLYLDVKRETLLKSVEQDIESRGLVRSLRRARDAVEAMREKPVLRSPPPDILNGRRIVPSLPLPIVIPRQRLDPYNTVHAP